MNNNSTLFACATLALTFNDIYLIIVGISILVSTIIAIINAIKSNTTPKIDQSIQKQLQEIDEQLNKDKEDSTEK